MAHIKIHLHIQLLYQWLRVNYVHIIKNITQNISKHHFSKKMFFPCYKLIFGFVTYEVSQQNNEF